MLSEAHLRDIEMIVAGEIDNARTKLETLGQVMPRILFISPDEEKGFALDHVLMPAYASTPPGKQRDILSDALRLHAQDLGAIACLMIMEVWKLRGTKERPPDPKGYSDWSRHPDRIEEVVAVLETSAGVSIAHMPIIRKPGKPPTFAPGATWQMDVRASGRILSILPGARR